MMPSRPLDPSRTGPWFGALLALAFVAFWPTYFAPGPAASSAYALAIAWRRRIALHGRLMVCTGLTLVDPVVVRRMFWAQPVPTWNYQWLTCGGDLVLPPAA